MQEAQTKVQEIQKKLSQIHATGEAGAGAVKVTVDGHKKVIKLDIDKEFINPDEKILLQDLIIAAITLATRAVADKVKETIQQSIPGMEGVMPMDLML